MSTEIQDASGEVRLVGTILIPGATAGDVLTVQADGTLAPEPAGGGSQAGALGSADFLFTEVATAGTYTAALPVTAGTVVYDVFVYVLALWAADDALLKGGDTLGGATAYFDPADGFLVDVSTAAGQFAPYDPAAGDVGYDLAALGVNYQIGGTTHKYQTVGLAHLPSGNASSGVGILYPADDVVTISVTTTIAVPPVVPTGLLRVKVIYFAPVTAVDAEFS